MEVSGNETFFQCIQFLHNSESQMVFGGSVLSVGIQILDVKDKGICSFVSIAVSALITEITIGLKLLDGIK